MQAAIASWKDSLHKDSLEQLQSSGSLPHNSLHLRTVEGRAGHALCAPPQHGRQGHKLY